MRRHAASISSAEQRLVFLRRAMLLPWLLTPVALFTHTGKLWLALPAVGAAWAALALALRPSATERAALAVIGRGEMRRYPWLLFSMGLACLALVIALHLHD